MAQLIAKHGTVIKLPRRTFDFAYSTDWDRAADISVDDDHAGDLQAALIAAVAAATSTGNDIIVELTAGASYVRGATDFKTYRLPTRPQNETNWIILRSSGFSGGSPTVGTNVRVSPANAAAMANLPQSTSGGLPTMATNGPTHHWYLLGLDFSIGSMLQSYAPLFLGKGYANEVTGQDYTLSYTYVTTVDDLPHHIVVDRCYIHSDDDTLATGRARQGIYADGSYICIRNCYITNIKDTADAQGIIAWSGTGPWHIENNYIQATGENIMFGGDRMRFENVNQADVTIRRNHLQKNIAWKAPNLWGVKNIIELKHANRVLIEGNVLDTCWSDGQNGDAIVLTVRNQTFSPGGENPWAEVSDITVRYNIIHDVGMGINCHAYDNLGSGKGSRISKRWHFHDNLMYDVRADYWTTTAGRFFTFTTYDTLKPFDAITIEHNTCLFKADDQMNAALNIGSGFASVATNFTCKNNIWNPGQYHYTNLTAVSGAEKYTSNVMVARDEESSYASRIAAGDQATYYVADEYAGVGFADYTTHDYRLTTGRFRAGQSAQASDGLDMGANITLINTITSGVTT